MPRKSAPKEPACPVDRKLGIVYLVLFHNVGLLIHNLSVALARAVYARTKYVLLDDPLSAVVRTLLNLISKVIS